MTDGRLRYLELGCGQGVNLCLIAAAHPHIDFVGIDFNPAHIANAQGLAKAACVDGITNGSIKWLQYSGNTYIVYDQTDNNSALQAGDTVIKLTGLNDLSTATFDNSGLLPTLTLA